jgi:UDP-3-O-[3-hydroxymyristoyl] glucosamine N-acyltransferase
MSKDHENTTSLTVKELARLLECSFTGDGEVIIKGVSGIEDAQEGDITFLGHPKFRPNLDSTKASAVIIPEDEDYDRISSILSKNPYLSFIKTVNIFFCPYRPEPGIQSPSYISPSAKIGTGVSIGALSYIDDEVEIGDGTIIHPQVTIFPRVKIGKNCLIYPQVSIRENCKVMNNVIIHNGTVIGSDGFGYVQDDDGNHVKIPQTGQVVIEDDVEIGANSTVDRGTFKATRIKKGTKIDNLVQVAHNVEVGPHSILAAQTGIAGSTKVGKQVILGGQVGVSDHLQVGDNVIAAAKTGVTGNIPPGTFVAGYPHLEIRSWRKAWASITQLYDLIKDIRKLRKRVKEIEKKLNIDTSD